MAYVTDTGVPFGHCFVNFSVCSSSTVQNFSSTIDSVSGLVKSLSTTFSEIACWFSTDVLNSIVRFVGSDVLAKIIFCTRGSPFTSTSVPYVLLVTFTTVVRSPRIGSGFTISSPSSYSRTAMRYASFMA